MLFVDGSHQQVYNSVIRSLSTTLVAVLHVYSFRFQLLTSQNLLQCWNATKKSVSTGALYESDSYSTQLKPRTCAQNFIETYGILSMCFTFSTKALCNRYFFRSYLCVNYWESLLKICPFSRSKRIFEPSLRSPGKYWSPASYREHTRAFCLEGLLTEALLFLLKYLGCGSLRTLHRTSVFLVMNTSHGSSFEHGFRYLSVYKHGLHIHRSFNGARRPFYKQSARRSISCGVR